MKGCKPVNTPATEESKMLCEYSVQTHYIHTQAEVKKLKFSVTGFHNSGEKEKQFKGFTPIVPRLKFRKTN